MHLSYLKLDDRLDSVLDQEQFAPPRVVERFREQFSWSWLYHELSIEGVIVCEDDLKRALAGLDGRDYCDGVLLEQIRNAREAFNRVRMMAFRRKPVTRKSLQELVRVFHGDDGLVELRDSSGATQAYKHNVVEPDQIDEALDQVLAMVNDDSGLHHPVKRAILIHYKFIKAWPFKEHSAVVARMLSNMVLMQNGYPPALLHASDRQKYYHSLHYDPTRLERLIFEALEAQISLRERVFDRYRAPQMAVAAY